MTNNFTQRTELRRTMLRKSLDHMRADKLWDWDEVSRKRDCLMRGADSLWAHNPNIRFVPPLVPGPHPPASFNGSHNWDDDYRVDGSCMAGIVWSSVIMAFCAAAVYGLIIWPGMDGGGSHDPRNSPY